MKNCLPVFFMLLACMTLGGLSAALAESSPMHWSGDKTVWDRKTNKVELTGHAAVHQPGESLTADHITLDLNTRTLDAVGSCVYITGGMVIHGEEMHFNMETRTGTIVGGRVSGDRFTLTGERINRLGSGRFQTHRGGYSTCRDCPASWVFSGEDVDMEFGGYAYMKNVTAQVKDTPIFWLPYLVVPIKNRRQTGFLFPKFGASGRGLNLVLPFFWATSRSTDMTFGLGQYGGRGTRLEWEGRYQLTDRSGGKANFYYVRDKDYQPKTHRWGLALEQLQELPYGIEEKFRLVDVSDNLYPKTIGDVPGQGEAYLTSDLIFSRSTDYFSAYIAGRRFRNLLNINSLTDFDFTTVQAFPTAAVMTNDKFLFNSPVAFGFSLGLNNFTRTGAGFDRDLKNPPADFSIPYRQGQDPIRKATRVSVTPSLYTTLRPWGAFSIVPSLEYRSFFYSFHNELPNLSRGYLLFRTDLSAQLERIFETSNPDIPRVKHLIRPLLTYNLIPLVNEPAELPDGRPGHPFLQQIQYAQENQFSGYNFDDYDMVPVDESRNVANYFVPLGHSMTYGFSTQLIRRKGPLDYPLPGYQRSIELQAGQTLNFREFSRADDRRPFSRFFSTLGFNFDNWSAVFDYKYVPYIPIFERQKRHIFSTQFTYVLERAIHNNIFAFDRSFTVGYAYNTVNSMTSNPWLQVNYSINDYILPSATFSYDNFRERMSSMTLAASFQSPSQCWRLGMLLTRSLCPKEKETDSEYCIHPTFNFTMNLTGEGFTDMSQLASSNGMK